MMQNDKDKELAKDILSYLDAQPEEKRIEMFAVMLQLLDNPSINLVKHLAKEWKKEKGKRK